MISWETLNTVGDTQCCASNTATETGHAACGGEGVAQIAQLTQYVEDTVGIQSQGIDAVGQIIVDAGGVVQSVACCADGALVELILVELNYVQETEC